MGTSSTRAPESATTLSTKEAWDAAFAAWEAAKVDFDFAECAYTTAYNEAGGDQDADNNPVVAKLCDLMDRRAAVENEARFALVETPAPHLAAVSVKLDLLFGPENYGTDSDNAPAWHRDFPAGVIADVQRLQSDYCDAWLAAWTKDGGSVVIDDEGKAQIGWPAYDLSPSYQAPNADWPDALRDHAFISGQAAYDATMRARHEALKMVPGGVDMLKAHMRAKGIRVAVPVMEQAQ